MTYTVPPITEQSRHLLIALFSLTPDKRPAFLERLATESAPLIDLDIYAELVHRVGREVAGEVSAA